MALLSLPGIGATDKVPMAPSQNLYGQGASSGSRPWFVCCTGNKVAAGSMTADIDVLPVYSESEVATLVGARSEIAQQAREALASGAAVILAPVLEAAGGVAATLVLHYETVGSGTGSVTLYVGDETVSFVCDVTSKQTTMNAAATAVNAKSTLFCVATVGGAPDYDVTLTCANAGLRGNDWLAKADTTAAPAGSAWTFGFAEDVDSVMLSFATTAGATHYGDHGGATGPLTGALVVGGDALCPPARRVTVTVAASVGSYVNLSEITVTGTTLAGAPLVEVLVITGTAGGILLTTVGSFATVNRIDIEAQADANGHFQIGTEYSDGVETTAGYVHFTGGTGSDDCSNVINLLEATEYRRIAAAQNDAVNAARWEAHADSESAPLLDHLEQIIFGHNGTSAAAISLAQTTLNAFLCAMYPRRNSRKHPCQIAAKVAANRAVYEAQNPHERFDGKWNDQGSKLWTTVSAAASDEWTHAEMVALLDAGCSPLHDFGGTTCIVRSVTSHSLNGTDPDWRCLDTAWVTVSQRVRDDVEALATTEAENNTGVGPDLPDGMPQISGRSTPKIWNGTVNAYLEEKERAGWLKDVALNPPITEYNDDADRLETIVPCVVCPHQHQIFTSVRQIAG
jgi:phage tail sheath gpL-like